MDATHTAALRINAAERAMDAAASVEDWNAWETARAELAEAKDAWYALDHDSVGVAGIGSTGSDWFAEAR